ncbi:hypothetical protein I0C86_22375 [Plantactinospora sp. S1510]|uniref:Gas vesicle protein n=1 Tax=Plantactinospora alkalitolerans TaxID=2789879 RepID=A0ABS0GZP8_9ACTN|nr:hypothetical protein [Plantactinospora alkalitolerans]MBF9131691.1 hypothetical protein [Plantactinospora alkalitolerans]
MTESTNADQDPTPDYTKTRPDLALQILARIAQEDKVSIGVTLNVSGGIVTGTVIGRDRWFRELGDFVEASTDTPEARSLADYLGELMSGIAKPDDDDDQVVATLRYGYIHLVNARYVSGSRVMPSQGSTLWRGRLSEIAGFSIGILPDAA